MTFRSKLKSSLWKNFKIKAFYFKTQIIISSSTKYWVYVEQGLLVASFWVANRFRQLIQYFFFIYFF